MSSFVLHAAHDLDGRPVHVRFSPEELAQFPMLASDQDYRERWLAKQPREWWDAQKATAGAAADAALASARGEVVAPVVTQTPPEPAAEPAEPTIDDTAAVGDEPGPSIPAPEPIAAPEASIDMGAPVPPPENLRDQRIEIVRTMVTDACAPGFSSATLGILVASIWSPNEPPAGYAEQVGHILGRLRTIPVPETGNPAGWVRVAEEIVRLWRAAFAPLTPADQNMNGLLHNLANSLAIPHVLGRLAQRAAIEKVGITVTEETLGKIIDGSQTRELEAAGVGLVNVLPVLNAVLHARVGLKLLADQQELVNRVAPAAAAEPEGLAVPEGLQLDVEAEPAAAEQPAGQQTDEQLTAAPLRG
jgi:hypothetical protein